jgi:hypothetical protein
MLKSIEKVAKGMPLMTVLYPSWIEIPASDLERALAFYRGVFGLTDTPLYNEPPATIAVLLPSEKSVRNPGVSLVKSPLHKPLISISIRIKPCELPSSVFRNWVAKWIMNLPIWAMGFITSMCLTAKATASPSHLMNRLRTKRTKSRSLTAR